MSARRRTQDAHRGRALDLWQPPAKAGDPLACIATSFTFDAAFFETECLGRFLAMDSHPDESESVAYLVEREEKLAAARVCVLVDRRYAQEKESMRWDVLPVIVPHGIQHAKMSLLCWANHVRVIIGSGNLTEPGYRKNVELFGTIDARADEAGQVDLVRQCIDFLGRVLSKAIGIADREGPTLRAKTALSAVRAHVADWPTATERRVRVVCGGDGNSIPKQIQELWPGGPPREAHVLSPFFDSENLHESADALCEVLAKRGERSVDIYAWGEHLPDGRVRIGVPKPLIERFVSNRAETSAHLVPPEQDGEIRPLHAKSIVLLSDGWQLTLVGSSNFTRAGLGISDYGGNFEANLAYLIRSDDPVWAQLNRTWPDNEECEYNLDSENVAWDPLPPDDETGSSEPPLPAGFVEALYRSGSSPQLRITLGEGLPSAWSIRSPDGELLLESGSGGVGEHDLDWTAKPVPFLLAVRWTTEAGEVGAAWPVNVHDPKELPPPEELRGLSLEELLTVLSSTRPLHIAVAAVLNRRLKAGRKADDPAIDPHKRVNTETFLLRRTKRVALALAQLRERLERPVFSIEAFDWRLFGPVGAVTLAQALQKEARTPEEARFFLAELALALKRVRPDLAAKGGLPVEVVRDRLRACVEQVSALAQGAPDVPQMAIDRYISAAIEEARR